MAAPSPSQSPFSAAATTSLQSSTIIPICYTNRRLLIPWSSDFYSSSSCCCSVNNGRKRLRVKPVELITVDGYSEIGKAFDSPFNNGGFNGIRLSFKLLFGKRALWRRIIFASKKVRSIILLNAITIIYASNIPVVKDLETIVDPETFTVVRFAVAAISNLPFVFRARDDSDTSYVGLELGFWVSLGNILQALGLLTSDAGRASFLCMFTVIVVPLIDGMLGTDRPVYTRFGALFVHCRSSNAGIQWITSMCGFAGDFHASNPLSRTWGNVLDWISTFPWIPALYTGIFSTGLCLWVEMSAMRDVSATETAIIYGLEPVWGVAFAWFLLGERWGVSGWIRAALLLGRAPSFSFMHMLD